MIPLVVLSAIVFLAVALVVALLMIMSSRPQGSHHPYRRYCQDVDTEEECDDGDPISTKEMGPSKFMGV